MPSPKDMKQTRRGALGKGLNSLLGLGDDVENTNDSQTPKNEVESSIEGHVSEKVSEHLIVRLSPKVIEPNPHQPRKIFAEENLKTLAASLAVDGVIQPLLVSKTDKPGRYVLIAGERRWRAAQMAGLETVPAIIKEATSDDMLRIALIENIQRADLNVIEEAEAYASLINDFGLTQEQCAKKVGKDRVTITNALRMLGLPKEIQDDLMDNRLTMGHGRALLSLEDKKLMLRARDIVVKKVLNVRQTEQLCRTLKKGDDLAKPPAPPSANADLDYLAENLRSYLRTKVKLSGSGSRGRIEISYFSAAELERILGMVAPNIL